MNGLVHSKVYMSTRHTCNCCHECQDLASKQYNLVLRDMKSFSNQVLQFNEKNNYCYCRLDNHDQARQKQK